MTGAIARTAAAVSDGLAGVHPTPPDPALLEHILAEKALAHAHDATGALTALIQAFERFLGRIFGSQAAFTTASATRVVFLGAVGLFALWLLARMLRRLRPTRRRAGATADAGAPSRLDAPEDHLAAARAARAEGDLRGALRQQLLAALAGLEAAGLVAYGRHRTNREYVRDLTAVDGGHPVVAAAFRRLVDAYDRRFYGLLPVDEPGLDAVAAATAGVLEAARTGRRAA